MNLIGVSDQSTIAQSHAQSHELPAVLYMSITGNPTHLGHMAAVATAIDILKKIAIPVDEVRISLSSEGYLKSKVFRNTGPKKIALSQIAREYLLNGAIKEAERRNMFEGVKVSYWNDQDQGFSDHPESYQRLAQTLKKTHRVFLVAGIDCCMTMNNWPGLDHAIVIHREMDDSNKPLVAPASHHNRIYALPLYPEYVKLSSTAIQKGSMQLEPASLQEYFNNEHSKN